MVAPVLPATLEIEFGADTQVGGGGYELAFHNTGGTIAGTSTALSGTNSTHFQISSSGVITPTQTGRDAGLANGPYTLTARCYDSGNANFDDVVITINITPNTQHIGILAGASSTTSTPNTLTQFNNAYKQTPLTAAYVAYGGSSIAKTIKYRRDVVVPVGFVVDGRIGKTQNNTGIITHISEDATHPARFSFGNGVAKVSTIRFYPRNSIWQDLEFYFPLYRRLNAAGWTGAAGCVGYPVGYFEANGITFITNDISEVGYGQCYNGPWNTSPEAGLIPTTGNDIIVRNCRWEGLWRRGWSQIFWKSGVSYYDSFTFENNEVKHVIVDFLSFAGPCQNMRIANNTIHSPINDTHACLAVRATSSGMTGATNGTKALVFLNGMGPANCKANVNVFTYGGIKIENINNVYPNNWSNFRVTITDTGGNVLSTMTSAQHWNGPRYSILLSLDTTGTSRFYMCHEDDSNNNTWTEEGSFTAAGQNINLTGAVDIWANPRPGGVDPWDIPLMVSAVWQGKAPDITQASVRNLFVSQASDYSKGTMTTDMYDALVADVSYGEPILCIFDDWRRLAAYTNITGGKYWSNKGSGGQIVTSGCGTDHGDQIQFKSGANTSNVLIENNHLNGYNEAWRTVEGGRYEYDADQPIFMEDVQPGSYIGTIIRNNLCCTGSNYGTAIFNPTNCLMENNTIIRDPNYPRVLPIYNRPGTQYRISSGTQASWTGNQSRNNVMVANTLTTEVTGQTGYNNIFGVDQDTSAALVTLTPGTGQSISRLMADLFAGDGGTWDLSTPAKAKAALARKPGGPLDLYDIGANLATDVVGAVPAYTVPPTISPGADNYVGTILTLTSFGTATNSPTSYDVQLYKDDVALGSLVTDAALGQTFSTSSGAGDYKIGSIPKNATGPGAEEFSNTITITVAPTYVANNDLLELDYAASGSINVLANDLNLDDVTSVTGGSVYVSAVLNVDNSITVTALPGFSGSINFSVTCTGNSGAVTRTSNLTVTVAETRSFTITTS